MPKNKFMNIQNKVVRPISIKQAHRSNEQCAQMCSAWIAVGGNLGREITFPHATFHELKCSMRFCFMDESLEKPKRFIQGNLYAKDARDARIKSLAVALRNLSDNLELPNLEVLKCWRLRILSTFPEFLDDIESKIKAGKCEDIAFTGGFKDPIEFLKHFHSVDLVLINKTDVNTVFKEKCAIQWN